MASILMTLSATLKHVFLPVNSLGGINSHLSVNFIIFQSIFSMQKKSFLDVLENYLFISLRCRMVEVRSNSVRRVRFSTRS